MAWQRRSSAARTAFSSSLVTPGSCRGEGTVQQGKHLLADPPGLLQVRIAGEDELVETECRVLGDPLGDLLVAADQRGRGALAHQSDAGPEVGRDLEAAGAGADRSPVQRGHARLPDG